jgi:alkylhydroperoxidase family enzyme
MPIIEPIPHDQLSAVARKVIEDGEADGLYATPIPLQIFAYHTRQLLTMDGTRRARGDGSLLGGRILELIRIRSAQLGECQPCMQSRKHDSITDEDVACLLDVGAGNLTDQERLAVTFIDLLSADHHAIDADFYRELAQVFTAAQIVELGFTCAGSMGIHRFLHTLEIFGTDEPVIAYASDQVDTRRDEDAVVTADAVAV